MEVLSKIMKVRVFVCCLLFVVAYAPSSVFAQANPCNPQPCPSPCPNPCPSPSPTSSTAFEINPYGGFYWPGKNDEVGKFQKNQLLGVRGGGYVTPGFEIGGNVSWSNHFQPKSSNTAASLAGAIGFPQGRVQAWIWEPEFTYNFGPRSGFGHSFKPYVVGSIGGLTARVKDTDSGNISASCAQIGSDKKCFVLNVRPINVNNNNNNNSRTAFAANDVLESKDTFLTFSYGGGVKWNRVWGSMGFFGDFRGRTTPNFFGNGTTWPELSAGLTFSWGEP
jgi:hypothetical protein